MKKVTVAKALKIKNEVAGEMKEVMNLISFNNSRDEGTVCKFDVDSLFIQYGELLNKLVAVKTAIQKANNKIAEELVRLAETKAMCAFLKNLNTEEGEYWSGGGYGEASRKMVKMSVIDAVKKRDLVKLSELAIRDLQDQIDTYNASTFVEIPD